MEEIKAMDDEKKDKEGAKTTQSLNSDVAPTQSLVQTLSIEKETTSKKSKEKRPMTEEQLLEEEEKKKKGTSVLMKNAIEAGKSKHQKLLEQLSADEARRIALEEGTLHLQGSTKGTPLARIDSDI